MLAPVLALAVATLPVWVIRKDDEKATLGCRGCGDDAAGLRATVLATATAACGGRDFRIESSAMRHDVKPGAKHVTDSKGRSRSEDLLDAWREVEIVCFVVDTPGASPAPAPAAQPPPSDRRTPLKPGAAAPAAASRPSADAGRVVLQPAFAAPSALPGQGPCNGNYVRYLQRKGYGPDEIKLDCPDGMPAKGRVVCVGPGSCFNVAEWPESVDPR